MPQDPHDRTAHRFTSPRLSLHSAGKVSPRGRIDWRYRSSVAALRALFPISPINNAASVADKQAMGESVQAIPWWRVYGCGWTVKVLLATRPRALLRFTLTAHPPPRRAAKGIA
jgi:hypothetical protein